MTVINEVRIIESIKAQIREINSLDDFLGIYQFIKRSLEQEKERLEDLPIDLIIVENIYGDYAQLEHHGLILQKKEREVIHVFIFGDFSEDSAINWGLSEILADFLVEYLIIPILETINYADFQQRSNDIFTLINDSILVYESKRSLS